MCHASAGCTDLTWDKLTLIRLLIPINKTLQPTFNWFWQPQDEMKSDPVYCHLHFYTFICFQTKMEVNGQCQCIEFLAMQNLDSIYTKSPNQYVPFYVDFTLLLSLRRFGLISFFNLICLLNYCLSVVFNKFRYNWKWQYVRHKPPNEGKILITQSVVELSGHSNPT